jgi:hypothetical protein
MALPPLRASRQRERRLCVNVISLLLQRTDMQFNVYVSYLEIYNEAGYDLLDPSHETKALEELP